MNTFVSNLDPAGHHRQLPPQAPLSSGSCYGKKVQRHQPESILNNETSNRNKCRTNENVRSMTMVSDFPELQKSYEYYSRQINSLFHQLQNKESADGWRLFTTPFRSHIDKMINLNNKMKQLLDEARVTASPRTSRKCKEVLALLTHAVNSPADFITHCKDEAGKRYFVTLSRQTQERIASLARELSGNFLPKNSRLTVPDEHIIKVRTKLSFELGQIRRKILLSRSLQKQAFDAELLYLNEQLEVTRKNCLLSLKETQKVLRDLKTHAPDNSRTSHEGPKFHRSVQQQKKLDDLLQQGKAPRDYCLEILGADEKTAMNSVNLRQLYHKLCLRWHPDKNPDKDAPIIFKKISQAYEILKH